MALGDGVRRNIATVSVEERNRLRDAFVALRQRNYADGVSRWFKQDQIHQATHVHAFAPRRGIAFLPWHREICNRLEALLREVDPLLSLHYWDWTTDPRASADGNGGTTNLFTAELMGSSIGRMGAPFDSFDNGGVREGSRDATGDPALPPREVTRGMAPGAPGVPSDQEIIRAGEAEPEADQYARMRAVLESAHNDVHSDYIGGTIADPHTSFQDPFVFLLHSNVDRLFAMWQSSPGRSWRLDPERVYGAEGSSDSPPTGLYDPGIMTPVEPWAGNARADQRVVAVRPWTAPDDEQVVKDYKHPSIVTPPLYDTMLDPLGSVIARHNLTSAQHQQTVDELLRLRYRPIWVSGYGGDQPRFASIWERRVGPRLEIRHNLTAGQHQALVDELFPQGFRQICVSGYTVGGEDRFASIWEQRPGPAVAARHNLTASQHQETVDELLPQGFRPVCVSGYGAGAQDRYASIWLRRPGPAMMARHNLTGAQHQQTVDELLPQGFRPAFVSGYGVDGQDRYASTWEQRPGPGLALRHNLDAAQHQQAVDEFFGQGFRPTSVSGYTVAGQDRYASTWEQLRGPDLYASIWERTGGPELITRHNLTSAQHQLTVDTLFAQGFRPTWIAGYSVLGEDRYTSIWLKQPGPALHARHNLTAEQHQRAVDDFFAQGFRPICVSGYTVSGEDRFASIWEQTSGPELVARHNLTGEQHQQAVEQLFAQGFRPTAISGYGGDGEHRFASIWIKAGGPELVARHGLTAEQHQQTADQLFGQGFRPTCVSGYGIDGQDFYASIWVRQDGPELVARHNLTSAQHQQTVDELLAQGFRPTCVSGYGVR